MGTVQGVGRLGEEPGSHEVCIQADFEAESLNIAHRSCQVASWPVQMCRPMGRLALPGLLRPFQKVGSQFISASSKGLAMLLP